MSYELVVLDKWLDLGLLYEGVNICVRPNHETNSVIVRGKCSTTCA